MGGCDGRCDSQERKYLFGVCVCVCGGGGGGCVGVCVCGWVWGGWVGVTVTVTQERQYLFGDMG